MRYQTAGAFRTALEARLLASSRQSGMSLARLRKLVVFDRMLVRFLYLAPERWLVKGGVALDYRLEQRARTTKDLDLAWSGAQEDVRRAMVELPSVSLVDYFVFQITSMSVSEEREPHRAIRYRVSAQLDGRRFDDVALDVGFDYPEPETPDRLRSHSLLTFAGIEPLVLPALPLERHLAEKLHAYTRVYQRGMPSTRVKDFVDIILIGSIAEFRMDGLRNALNTVFDERSMQPLPEHVPTPPASWRTPLRSISAETGTPTDPRTSYELVAKMLNPVLVKEQDSVSGARWDPIAWEWKDDDPLTS